jgi:xanthine/uracil/vitamin C permease (AzgA family)
MKVSQSQDIVVSCLLFSLCLSVLPSIAASRTLVVFGGRMLQTSKLFEKRNR